MTAPLRRTPAAVAVVGLLVLSLAGCGGGSSDGGAATPTSTTVAHRSGDPDLIFEDTFDGSGPLDPKIWKAVVDVRHEASLTDRTTNARREDGNLVIEARAEPELGVPYTSALVQTRRTFRYGRFEARMKLPTGPGTWPAFWLLGRPTWPDAGEIDVMEHYARYGATDTPNYGVVESNLHSSPPPGKPKDTTRGRVTRTKIDPTTWHTYAVEWEEGEIRFFVDGTLTATHTRPADDPAAWPFDDHPEVIAFDLFLGAYAGPVKAEAMPQRLLVDRVTVRRLP